jgi:hypothetical protein
MIITNTSSTALIFISKTNVTYTVDPNGGSISVVQGEIPDLQISILTAKGAITTTGWTPPSEGGGGGGGGTVNVTTIQDMVFMDDSGTTYIKRDNGATPPVFTHYTIDTGAVYTPGANPRPYTLSTLANNSTLTTINTSIGSTNTNLGAKADVRGTWYDSAVSLIALFKLWIAVTVDAGSHVYNYTNGNLTTDVWTLFGVTRTKTYTYTNNVLTSESDWV